MSVPKTSAETTMTWGDYISSKNHRVRSDLEPGQWVRFMEFTRYNGAVNGKVSYSPLFKVVKHFEGTSYGSDYLLMDIVGKAHLYNSRQWSGMFQGDRVQILDDRAVSKFLGNAFYQALQLRFKELVRQ